LHTLVDHLPESDVPAFTTAVPMYPW
jgi:hypothetical protein